MPVFAEIYRSTTWTSTNGARHLADRRRHDDLRKSGLAAYPPSRRRDDHFAWRDRKSHRRCRADSCRVCRTAIIGFMRVWRMRSAEITSGCGWCRVISTLCAERRWPATENHQVVIQDRMGRPEEVAAMICALCGLAGAMSPVRPFTSTAARIYRSGWKEVKWHCSIFIPTRHRHRCRYSDAVLIPPGAAILVSSACWG